MDMPATDDLMATRRCDVALAVKSVRDDAGYSIATYRLKTSVGPAAYHVATPIAPRFGAAPLVALHGISREADVIRDGFAEAAARRGRVVIAPSFDEKKWRTFQRPTRRARPDIALLEIIEDARDRNHFVGRKVNLFGYSGGGQLAHRFAMLYPHLIASLHVGAAGWYCMPDASLPYPYGVGPAESGADWSRNMSANLASFLELPVNIYVGAEDRNRDDPTLRRNPIVDASQGVHRHARAAAYVASAAASGGAAKFVELEGCGHRFDDCVKIGGLADHVLNCCF